MVPRAGPSKRSLSTQITYLAIAAATALLAVVVMLASWAVMRIDERALERENRFVQVGLEEVFERLPKEQDSSAIWDEAVLSSRANDGAWLDENLVEWMGAYYDHDQVFLLDPRNEPVRAAKDGSNVDPTIYEEVRDLVQPLVARLRAAMQAASAGMEDSTEAITGLGEIDAVAFDGGAAIISIRPVVPSSAAVTQEPGTEFLHVSLLRLNEPVIRQISQKFSLQALGFSLTPTETPGYASQPLFNTSGRIVGFFNWLPDRPALELVSQTAPVVVLGILAGLIALALLLLRLRRTSSKLEVSEAHAQFLAFHDPLTGVPNRALFEDRLERALATMRRTGGKIALHYIDLDRFKHVNDTLGHPAGDELIRQAATRLSEMLREADTIARLGGDEFAIIQVDPADHLGVEAQCERLLRAIDEQFDLGGDVARVGASIGVVIADDPSVTPRDMMRQADIALYEAKAAGRGRYRLFAGEMDETVRGRRALERELRAALREGTGLQLVYQPIYGAMSGALLGAEALVRWEHKELGLLAPDQFISIAEERGLIEPLGLWVLRTACRFAVTSNIPWIAVNVSPMQFSDENLAARVLDVVAQSGLPPRRLEIEITEGLLLQNSPVVQETLRKLRAAGVRIALDDFGTGYSSISYLRTYGVDKLKIDRSFVEQLGQGKDIDSIVKSIIDLARSMRMQVTAEGVETVAQQQLLVGMGCNQLQGFLLSRPLPEADLATQLSLDAHGQLRIGAGNQN
ncbi:MAG TPA: EAL domain-containing protein [Devosiaceae bacterium]|nr:EAL domain-containing protein [Devosiaceae bacterium]